VRHFLRDLRYACRGLLRSPVFTIVALLSIALGVGANTAIFTFVDQVLLRQLPVREPRQLVLMTQLGSHYGSNNGWNATSYPMYEDFRDAFVDQSAAPRFPRVSISYELPAKQPLFSGLFCRYAMPFNIGFDGSTERVRGEIVSGSYFEVLGVGAAVGRVITPDDDRIRGGNAVAVLSYDYWHNRFGSDPGIVGRTITVNSYPLTIIGVSERGFNGIDIGSLPCVRVPMMMKAQMTPLWDDLDNRRTRWVNVFGRLKPGVTAEDAKSALQPYFHQLRELETREPAFRNASAYAREQFLKGTIDVLPAALGLSMLRRQLEKPLWVLMATVALVLLIACANVAGLLVARSAARQKEIALRLALGASRGRIVGQLLTESLLLAVAGGAVGILVASWTSRFLFGFMPSDTPIAISAALDRRMLAFNFALSLATGMLFGLIPALRSTRPGLAPALKDQAGWIVSDGVGARKALVAVQVTLAVLLLVGAGLFIRTLRNLEQVDLGLRPESLVSFTISPGSSGYSANRAKQFFGTLLDRLRNASGVTQAGLANMPILEGGEQDWSITIEGYEAKPGERMNTYFNCVSPEYFATLGMPLLVGRDFDARDVDLATSPPSGVARRPFKVAIVNASFVRHYFGDGNPLGRHFGLGSDPGTPTPIEIVGVVGDAKYTAVREEIARQMFFPVMQDNYASSAIVYLRTSGDARVAFGAAQRTLQQLDPNVPMYNLRTVEQQIGRSLLNERLIAMLSSGFGVLATLLAMVGLYGVMAYTVLRRTREIGLRVALGAVPRDVIWLVMREVLLLVGTGVTLGLAAAWALTRYVQSQLYGVAATDPTTIAAAVVILSLVAAAAGYVPARRATRVDPVRALRYE
jgi:predicted permease